MDASGDGLQFSLKPIGFIRTPFRDRADAPQQPQPAEGLITLYPGQNFEQALCDLDGFEYIWIVGWFHLNRAWKPKVLPPRGSAIKRGVFATRSPHRPNPIAFSLARLIEVKGRTVRVADTDLLDGTPILDLKPYLADIEAQPHARSGWLTPERGAANYSVEWSALAFEQSAWLHSGFEIELRARAERVLARDPRPHPYRRIAEIAEGLFELAIKSWRMRFHFSGAHVTVLEIVSGYPFHELSAQQTKPLHDHAAHLAFHARWPQNPIS